MEGGLGEDSPPLPSCGFGSVLHAVAIRVKSNRPM